LSSKEEENDKNSGVSGIDTRCLQNISQMINIYVFFLNLLVQDQTTVYQAIHVVEDSRKKKDEWYYVLLKLGCFSRHCILFED